MKTLIYGAGPIGRWLALRLGQANKDVTLLARADTLQQLRKEGIVITDGFTGERQIARVNLVDRLNSDDHYDLVVVAMRKSSRLAVCPTLAANTNVEDIIFLGNDISGFHRYFDHLPKEKVLLGFPGAGGGTDGNDLVFVDRDKPNGNQELFEGAGVPRRQQHESANSGRTRRDRHRRSHTAGHPCRCLRRNRGRVLVRRDHEAERQADL